MTTANGTATLKVDLGSNHQSIISAYIMYWMRDEKGKYVCNANVKCTLLGQDDDMEFCHIN